jgi:hypothetical protein
MPPILISKPIAFNKKTSSRQAGTRYGTRLVGRGFSRDKKHALSKWL